MNEHSRDVSVADFDEQVLAASCQVPVIVDFWAPWCQPCRILKPILEKLATEYGGRFRLAKINSDENPEISARYGVRGIPAVKAFRDGEQVDEFTGALPEAQVRDFLDRLIPSPAEPLRLEAGLLATAGKTDAALARLDEAIALDPKNEVARLDWIEVAIGNGQVDAAAARLEALGHRLRDAARAEALGARLQLARGGAAADPAALRATLGQNPDDHATRLQLANALALQHDYRGACEQFLELVKRDRRWNEEAGRKGMLNLFTLLTSQPQHDDLVREYRIQLARTLN